MFHRHQLAAALGALALVSAPAFAASGATLYDFSTVTGSSTPLTLDGATFTSPSDPGAYTVGPNGGLFSTLPATVLSSAGSAAELDIAFAAPVSQISFSFAIGDFFALDGDDTLTLTPNVGNAITVHASLPGGDFYPQGTLSFSGAAFTSLSITSGEPLAIGNLQTVAAVPELPTWALFGLGLVGVAALRRRG